MIGAAVAQLLYTQLVTGSNPVLPICLLYIMKTEKIKDELNDIHKELAYIRGMLQNVSNQMQELRDDIRGAPHQTEELRVRELYEHPWYEYKRQELVASRDYYGGPEGEQDVSI